MNALVVKTLDGDSISNPADAWNSNVTEPKSLCVFARVIPGSLAVGRVGYISIRRLLPLGLVSAMS